MRDKEIARYQAMILQDAMERRGLVIPEQLQEFAICPAFAIVVPAKDFADGEVVGIWTPFDRSQCGYDQYAGDRSGLNLMGVAQMKAMQIQPTGEIDTVLWAMMGKEYPRANVDSYLQAFAMTRQTPKVVAVAKYLHRCYFPMARMSSGK